MSPAAPSLRAEANRALRWNGVAGASSAISQLLQLVLLARILSPSDFGVGAVAMACIGFFQTLADFGLNNALVRTPAAGDAGQATSAVASEAIGDEDFRERARWSTALGISLLGSFFLWGLLVLLAAPLESLLALPGLAELLRWGGIAIPFSGVASLAQAALQKELGFRAMGLNETTAASVSLLAALSAGWITRGAEALVIGLAVLAAWRGVSLFLASPLRLFGGWDVRELAPLLGFARYQLAERALNFAAGNLDRLLIARVLGAEAAGYYAVAAQLALRPLAIFGPFAFRTLYPLFSRIHADKPRLEAAHLKSVGHIALVLFPLYALLEPLSEPLLYLLLGPEWQGALPLFRIFVLLGLLTGIGQPTGGLLLALGRADIAFRFNVLNFCLRLGALGVGTLFGAEGLAWALVAASAGVMYPVDFAVRRRLLGTRPLAYVSVMAPYAFAGVLAGAGVWLFLHYLPPLPPWLSLSMGGLLGLVLYAGTLWPAIGERLWREWVQKTPGSP